MLRQLLLAGLLASTLAFAQRGGGGGGGGGRGGGGTMPNVGFGTAAPLDRVSDSLKLTKDQKKEFKAAMDDAQKEATPIHEQILKSRLAIAEAVAAGKNQEELIKAEGVLEAQMTEIELRTFAKITSTLDEEQKPRARMLFMMMPGIFARKNWNATEN